MGHLHIHRQRNYTHHQTVKHINIRIAYCTDNNLLHHLTQSPHFQDIYTHSGIYKLMCPDCGMTYVGQTGWDFGTRFNEHKSSFCQNTQTSKYAHHLTTHWHAFGNTQDTMQILQLQTNGMDLNTIECFYIYKGASVNTHLNDDYTIPNNNIFKTILK